MPAAVSAACARPVACCLDTDPAQGLGFSPAVRSGSWWPKEPEGLRRLFAREVPSTAAAIVRSQLTRSAAGPALTSHLRPEGLMYFAALAWLSFEGIQGDGGLRLMTVGQRTQCSQGALARELRLVPGTGRIRVDDAAR